MQVVPASIANLFMGSNPSFLQADCSSTLGSAQVASHSSRRRPLDWRPDSCCAIETNFTRIGQVCDVIATCRRVNELAVPAGSLAASVLCFTCLLVGSEPALYRKNCQPAAAVK